MSAISQQLVMLYSQAEWTLMRKHGAEKAFGAACQDLNQAWGRITKGSIRRGLTVGCGGEATQVIGKLQASTSARTSDFFSIRKCSGYATTHGMTAHVVTVILPVWSAARNRRDPGVGRTSWAARHGLVLDTWWYNVGFSKQAYSLHDFFRHYSKNMKLC